MSFNRARSLPPSDFTDPKLAALPALVRLTAAGLRMFADDEGRGLVRLRSMIAEMYEYDLSVTESVVEEHLLLLDDAGWLTLYQADGMSLFQIRYWPPVAHMRPSDLPPPPGYRSPQRGQHDTLDESYERQEQLHQQQEQPVGNPYTFPPQQQAPQQPAPEPQVPQQQVPQNFPPAAAMPYPGESGAAASPQAEQQVGSSYALSSPGVQDQLQMIHQAQASQPSPLQLLAQPETLLDQEQHLRKEQQLRQEQPVPDPGEPVRQAAPPMPQSPSQVQYLQSPPPGDPGQQTASTNASQLTTSQLASPGVDPSPAETWATPPQNTSPPTSDELTQKTAELQGSESFMKPSRSLQEAFTAVARESARAGAGAGARTREGVRVSVGAGNPVTSGENLDAEAVSRGQVYPNPGTATPQQPVPQQQTPPQAQQQSAVYSDPTVQAAEALPRPPSPFCSQHQPWGTEEACGPCRTTRMAMDIYNEAKARVGLSTPAAPPAPPAAAPAAPTAPTAPPTPAAPEAPPQAAPQKPSSVRFVAADPPQPETDNTDWSEF